MPIASPLDRAGATSADSTAVGDVVCTWCGAVKAQGDPKALKSHGICRPCGEKYFRSGSQTPQPTAMEAAER